MAASSSVRAGPRVTAWVVAATFVGGGLGGVALDQLHVRSGALAYPHPVLGGQPLWVAPQFGAGVLAIVAGMLAPAAWVRRRGAVPGARVIATDAAWFVGAYGATALWWRHHAGALTAGLVVTWLLRLAVADRWRPPALGALTGLALAIGGCAYEGTLAATGAFGYARPSIYHVPWWLAGIYLHGAPLALAVTTRLRLILWPGDDRRPR